MLVRLQMLIKNLFLKDENSRVDYGPALLFCDTYVGDQFEYLCQIDIVLFA